MSNGRAVIIYKDPSKPGKGMARYVVSAGQTIMSALRTLGISTHKPLVAVVNGTTADLAYTLEPEDIVQLLPQIAGG